MSITKTDEAFLRGLSGRQHWSEADARRAVELCEASGQSRTAFARAHGLRATRLAWWKKRLAEWTVATSEEDEPEADPPNPAGEPALRGGQRHRVLGIARPRRLDRLAPCPGLVRDQHGVLDRVERPGDPARQEAREEADRDARRSAEEPRNADARGGDARVRPVPYDVAAGPGMKRALDQNCALPRATCYEPVVGY